MCEFQGSRQLHVIMRFLMIVISISIINYLIRYKIYKEKTKYFMSDLNSTIF